MRVQRTADGRSPTVTPLKRSPRHIELHLRWAKARVFWPLAMAVLLLLVGRVVLAQTGGGFDLSWWTVDNGGGSLSGDGYTLLNTMGQPDAATLSGGGYTLYGGFWGPGPATTPPPTPTPAAHLYLPVITRN